MAHPRPILAMSLCLGDAEVRYDGAAIRDPFVARLLPHVELRPVCPEVEIGLGVPRDPILIDRAGRLVQPATGRDLTGAMREFSARFASSLRTVDGFLLKSRSPSCGLRDTKRAGRHRGAGLFAEALRGSFSGIVFEDEARLQDLRHRDRFLTRLFLAAALRRLRTPTDLLEFHARQRLRLQTFGTRTRHDLDRLALGPHPSPPTARSTLYAARFTAALSIPRPRSSLAAVLRTVVTPLAPHLPLATRRRLHASLRSLTSRRLPLPHLLSLVHPHLHFHPDPSLRSQSLLFPYPAALFLP